MKRVFTKLQIGKLFIFFLLVFLSNCTTVRFDSLNTNNDKVLESIVKDYCKVNPDLIKYKYFRIDSYQTEDNNFEIYRIAPNLNKVVLSSDGKGYFPIDYIKVGRNIFFIEGETTSNPSTRVYNLLRERKLIDSTMLQIEQGVLDWNVVGKGRGLIMTNDKLKITTYVICNNKIINKWRTNKSEVSAKNIEKATKKGCD